MLRDNHGRTISYLRLAVTDRCNLRCFYCMPEEGIDWLPREQILSYEEMLRISSLLTKMGVEKIRITGGEPFVRSDLMILLSRLSGLQGLKQLTLTTNGVLTAPHVPELKKLGIRSVNLSLDTLDRNRFMSITHRDELPRVLQSLEAFLSHGMEVKLNAVVMGGKNTDDIVPLVQLTKSMPVSVRFIEEMPFNGGDAVHRESLHWTHQRIMDHIRAAYPHIKKISDAPFSTSYNYHISGHQGDVGVIAAFSRTFCGTCNRIRITPAGLLKTCLYDDGVLNLKALLRSGCSDELLGRSMRNALQQRAQNGHEAEQRRTAKIPVHESMATIGG